jgi:hypothetical protein
MKGIRYACVLVVLVCAATIAWAGAINDLRIDTREDEKRNKIYLLTNTGSRLIEAKVEMKKECTGNERKPLVRTFWVEPGKSKQIAKAWSQTACRHSYRVLEAEYR